MVVAAMSKNQPQDQKMPDKAITEGPTAGAIMPLPEYETAVAAIDSNPLAAFLDPQLKEALWKAAGMLSKSQLVPVHFQGKQEDCFLMMDAAQRLRIPPLLMLQKTYIVNSKPAFDSSFLITLINLRGGFTHPLRFRYEGEPDTDERACIAWTSIPGEDEPCEVRVSMRMAKAEGWTKPDKHGKSKYASMLDQMLAYRCAGFFSRLYCPHVTMGWHTHSELEEEGRSLTPTASELLAGAAEAEVVE